MVVKNEGRHRELVRSIQSNWLGSDQIRTVFLINQRVAIFLWNSQFLTWLKRSAVHCKDELFLV
jgi:hypothetical protein